MKFAINYSTPALKLYKDKIIEIDFFKCPPWPEMIAEALRACRVAVHFEFRAGNGKLKEVDWQKVAGFLDSTATPYINLHLEPRVNDFPGFQSETTDVLQSEQILKQTIEDVKVVVQYFGAESVILENVPYRGAHSKVFRTVVEPQVITRIIEQANCGLLLDIAHARIAAQYLGMDEYAYISQLPTERLRELHFTGVQWQEGVMQDHLEASEADWRCLAWVLENIRTGKFAKPWMLALEYGGIGEKYNWRSDPQVIADQAPKLHAMIKHL